MVEHKKICCGYFLDARGKDMHSSTCPRLLTESYLELKHQDTTFYLSSVCEEAYRLFYRRAPTAQELIENRTSLDDFV